MRPMTLAWRYFSTSSVVFTVVSRYSTKNASTTPKKRPATTESVTLSAKFGETGSGVEGTTASSRGMTAVFGISSLMRSRSMRFWRSRRRSLSVSRSERRRSISTATPAEICISEALVLASRSA